jgi:GNAT superfamily N-acetyltransferase
MTGTAPDVAVRIATAADLDPLADVLTEAFVTGPLADWLIPDAAARHEVYARCFRLVLAHAFDVGYVRVGGDGAAVAVWFPMTEPQQPSDYEERLVDAVGPWLDRFLLKATTCDPRHPVEPHHYLAYLGVAPARQGTGLGSALLDHVHAELDAAGLPAYLEATNARNRDLYLRHGYTTAGPFTLPDGGPPMWGMWRAPR